jgi:hypothetical protein
MGIDRTWAEEHGLTLREFQRLMHSAQMKIMLKETLTEQEREVWDFAMNGDGSTEQRVFS